MIVKYIDPFAASLGFSKLGKIIAVSLNSTISSSMAETVIHDMNSPTGMLINSEEMFASKTVEKRRHSFS